MDTGFILILILLSMLGATYTWRSSASFKSATVHYRNHKGCCKGPNFTEMQMAEIKTKILCVDLRMRDHLIEDELDYLTRKKCLNSVQIKELLGMISSDLIKYGCARSLLNRVHDPHEFYLVANGIHDVDLRLKLKMEIYDYVNSVQRSGVNSQITWNGNGVALAPTGGEHLSFSDFLKKNKWS